MSERTKPTLTMLQAIELFRSKPAGEWTRDDLAAFQDCIEQSPLLIGSLGGQPEIDRRVADVRAALEQVRQPPPPQLGAVTAAPGHRPRSKIGWRALEATVAVVLIAGACAAIFQLWPSQPQPAASATASEVPAERQPPAIEPASQTQDHEVETDPEEVPAVELTDDRTWHGWSVEAASGTEHSLTDDWDLSDPSNPRPTKLLTVEKGSLTLTQRRQIAADKTLLEIDVRLLSLVSRPGNLVVSVDGTTVAEASIGAGETKWPWHVPLAQWTGKNVLLQVHSAAADPEQKLVWWSVALVAAPTREPRAESALAQDLASTNLKIRLFAAKNAAKLEDLAALPALIEAIHDRALPVRQAAVAALLKYRDPRARQALRAALKNDADPALRTMIAMGLFRKASPEDVDLLIKALQDEHTPLRLAATRALADNSDPAVTKHLIELVSHPDSVLREAAASALVRRNDPAVAQAFLASLDKPDAALKACAAKHFSQFPNPQAVPGLIVLIQEKGAAGRQAVRALGRISDDAAIETLGTLLKDPDPAVSSAARSALKQSRHPKAAQILKQAGITK